MKIGRHSSGVCVLAVAACAPLAAAFGGPPASAPAPRVVPAAELERIYDEVKTPYKHGIILRGDEGESVDCPNVFRFGDIWYMVYVGIKDKVGYQTFLAESDDLLRWRKRGTILPFAAQGEGDSPLFAVEDSWRGGAGERKKGTVPGKWDEWQGAGSIALVDPTWDGSGEVQKFDDKYWMTYFGGAKKGYEPDPLSIGVAWTAAPDRPKPWTRFADNPVLAPNDADARPFERATLYKSHVLWDKAASLGYPFVMFYNAKQAGPWIERIGMAVSKDMVHWTRYGNGPVIDNRKGFSGDPQIVRIGDLWVMFYFGAGWKPRAFDTFACSYDLVNWTKWNGPDLISPSEPWDKTFAHKPWVLKHDGVVYHFYCAVGDEGRVIALATSKDMRAKRE